MTPAGTARRQLQRFDRHVAEQRAAAELAREQEPQAGDGDDEAAEAAEADPSPAGAARGGLMPARRTPQHPHPDAA
ncbi:MAG: hypothetical protein WKF96_21785, partial [Solirubrobacteraceae bacterium]